MERLGPVLYLHNALNASMEIRTRTSGKAKPMGSKGYRAQAWGTLLFEYSRSNRLRIVVATAAMMLAIAWVDVRLVHRAAIGVLYIIPLVLAAGFLKDWQILALALISAVLREGGRPLAWSDDYLVRIATVAAAFAGAMLFVKQLIRNQQLVGEHVRQLEAKQQLERQLRHSQRLEAVGRLAGGVAHDFNNLLSVIIGFGDLALQQTEKDTPLRSDIEEIRKAADGAARLTRQLLEFSRRQLLRPQALDLNALISNLNNMLRRLIGEDIDLHLTLQPGLGVVEADPGLIEQVVMNLAVNARDAMPSGGRLGIETADVEIDQPTPAMPPGIKPGRYVILAVHDTGVGMDRNVQEHLFEPFFTTKEPGKGTGLGLSTVYGIVKQSGGEIWFRSEPGRGTTFTIYLPRVAAAPKTAGAVALPQSSVNGTATILLVEDDDSVRAMAREILRRTGYKVIEARSPAQAISITERASFHYDLLLTDVVMPEMSGPDLAERLTRRSPGLRVLFMTGYVDDSVLRTSHLNSGLRLLQKPLTADSLVQGVRTALGTGSSLRRSSAT
jgi:two-component system cell cycle sensor histidine kinase/response regulator CckA